uniref:Uncharacterized protein n=1 Tax=Aegilops tauschii subsp. strangulata TaxID=200361 RepID=A0A453KG95_AEGTS
RSKPWCYPGRPMNGTVSMNPARSREQDKCVASPSNFGTSRPQHITVHRKAKLNLQIPGKKTPSTISRQKWL